METMRCKAHRLKMDDVDRSVDDPALASLLAGGWRVICPIAMEEGGEVVVTLILAPPVETNMGIRFPAAVIVAVIVGFLLAVMSGVAL